MRCIAPATPGSGARWRSSSCSKRWRTIPSASPASSARHACSPRSTIRTSPRFTASSPTARPGSWSWSWSRARRSPIASRAGRSDVEEAIRIFLEIAEGLEAAHERGVVHRDLKPANVKLSGESGCADAGSALGVKILDFGLAKAMAEETAVGDAALSHSPTLTLAATQRGQIMGTAAYMSPQQAQGQPVDRRADIWAFGVCLLEALTGKRVFEGDNPSLVLASVLKDEPDWSSLPAATPPALRRVLRRCLEKSARARLPHIGAARPRARGGAGRGARSGAERGRGRARASVASPVALAAGVTLALALGFALGAAVMSVRRERRDAALDAVARSPLRYTVSLAELRPRLYPEDGVVRVSPDGSLLAITAGVGPGSRVYLRRRGSLELEPLAGTHGAWYTEFSPDGQWLLFGSFAATSCSARPSQEERRSRWSKRQGSMTGASTGMAPIGSSTPRRMACAAPRFRAPRSRR